MSWIPIGEPDVPRLSFDAEKVFSIMQCMDKPHIGIIRMKTRFGDDRIMEAIYEIRKMEAIRMGKLTNQQRAAIYQAYKDGTTQKELAKQYGVCAQAISQLCAKLAKAEQDIGTGTCEAAKNAEVAEKKPVATINPEFEAAVNEMIAESKSADAEIPSANAEPEKLPSVVRRALEAGYGDLLDEIANRRERIEELQAEIEEYEKDIKALKKWVRERV